MVLDDALHEAGARGQRRKIDAKEEATRRQRQQAQGRLRHHGQRPFRADKQRLQVVAGDVLDRFRAQADLFAAHQVGLQPQDIVPGHAVLEAARAAGVLGDVAADGRGLQTGRVGRIEKAGFFRGFLQVGGDDAGLDHGQKVFLVEAQDAIHAREYEHDAAAGCQRPTGVADAGTARHQRQGVTAAHLHDPGDIFAVFGENDRIGQVFQAGGVIGIAQQVFAVGEDLLLPDLGRQLPQRFFLDHTLFRPPGRL